MDLHLSERIHAQWRDGPNGGRAPSRGFWCVTLGATLGVQLLIDLIVPNQWANLISGTGLLIEALLAAVVCLWRSRQCRDSGSYLWSLVGIAELIHFAGRSLVGVETVFLHESNSSVALSDFVVFQWGSPLLLALSTPTERSAQTRLRWLDGVQVVLLFVVLFAVVFRSIPSTTLFSVALSPRAAVIGFALENLALAAFASARLQSRPSNEEQRSLLRSLQIFLWLYALLAPVYNVVNYLSIGTPVRLQWLLAIPELCLAWLALFPPCEKGSLERGTVRRGLAVILDNGSHVLFPAVVLFLAIHLTPEHLNAGLACIVASMLVYGIRSTILQVRYQQAQEEIIQAKERLEYLAHTDALTGLPNRRLFDESIRSAWDESRRFGLPLSLLMIDVDYFKQLNDAFGHGEGDRCLHAVAHALASVLRNEKDLVARYGGEEFAVVLYDAPPAVGEHVAQRMQRALVGLGLRNITPIGDTVTISVGVATSTGASSITELLGQADAALYCAKRAGRNRIERA
jgi:diguanylate cyclase (GGDEF)-like protein